MSYKKFKYSTKLQMKSGNSMKLPKIFNCPKCRDEKCVKVSIIKREKLGKVSCGTCKIYWETRINPLMKEVNIYTIWTDEGMPSKNDK